MGRTIICLKSLNQAVFAIALQSRAGIFGSLTCSNVIISSAGTDKSWSNDKPSNYNSVTDFTISGVNAVVSGQSVKCKLEKLVLVVPAAKNRCRLSTTTVSRCRTSGQSFCFLTQHRR